MTCQIGTMWDMCAPYWTLIEISCLAVAVPRVVEVPTTIADKTRKSGDTARECQRPIDLEPHIRILENLTHFNGMPTDSSQGVTTAGMDMALQKRSHNQKAAFYEPLIQKANNSALQ